VRDVPIFEKLDEISSEEAFAHTAFSIQNQNESFHAFCGLRILTWAIRGPRERGGVELSSLVSNDALGSPSFGEFGVGGESANGIDPRFGRLRPGRRRGRTISPSTS
jgi:hypothetical protein